MKRFVSILLCAVMLIGVLAIAPLGASAKSYVATARQSTYYVNGNAVTYRIPRILLSSSDAAAVNKKIISTYTRYFDEADAAGSNNYEIGLGINYYAYTNGSILSVVIENKAPWNNVINYDVFNFNVKTGKKLANKNILSAKGVSAKAAKNNVAALMRAELKTALNSDNASLRSFAKTQLNKSIAAKNLNTTAYYLGKNGKLMAKYRIYLIAGAESYYRIKALSAYAATPKLTGIKNSKSGIVLTWKKVAGASKYRVYVKTASGWKKLGDVSKTKTVCKNGVSGKTYTFTVRALDNKGNVISGYNKKGKSIKYKK